MKTVMMLIVPAEVDDVWSGFVPSAVIHRDGHQTELLAQPDMSKCRNESTASKNDVNFLPKQLDEEVIYGLLQASVARVLL